MTDLLTARMTMAMSLGFHIVLAAIGMVMPMLMVVAHRRWLRTDGWERLSPRLHWWMGVLVGGVGSRKRKSWWPRPMLG